MGLNKNKEKVNAYVKYSGLGFQLIVMVALGAFAGVKLDERYPLGSFPVFTLSLTIAAIVMAMYFLFKEATRK